MSPSKKQSKRIFIKNPKSAPKKKNTSVRSSRVEAKKDSAESRLLKTRIRQRTAREAAATAITSPQSIAILPPEVTQSSRGSSFRTNILRVVALLVVIGITIFIYSIGNRAEEFKQYGYAGAFVVALLANATVLLPAPGVAIVYSLGGLPTLNPLLLGISAGTGGAIGELSGYLAGFSGQAVIERTDVYNRIKPWVEKYGGWAILVLSAIPNPVFDAAGIAAGIVKMPFRTFILSVWAGQLIKMSLFAYAGHLSIQAIENYIK